MYFFSTDMFNFGHISVEKKYILGKKYNIFLPNIYFFSTDICPKSTKKRAGPLWFSPPYSLSINKYALNYMTFWVL